MRDIYAAKAGSFKALAPILAKWAAINTRLGTGWARDEDDAPWWYNERASLSLLAGAIWQTNGWAFEEFSTAKALALSHPARKSAPGRCDLMFGTGTRVYVAEAKQCWPNLGGSPATVLRSVRAALDKACADARRVPNWGFPRIGIVFAAPMLLASKSDRLDELLWPFLTAISNAHATAVAYAFPAAAATLRPPSSYKDYVFPGVAMLIRGSAKR